MTPAVGTDDSAYTDRLIHLESHRWKRWLNVQAPYRYNLRRMRPGRVLDIGCGVGRNLAHIDGNGVGIDHNRSSVDEARRRGFVAYTPEEFAVSEDNVPHTFDSLLFAHVFEHMDADTAQLLVTEYLPYVRLDGQVIVICPQERGYATDSTHVRFVDAAVIGALINDIGWHVEQSRSFPFPRFVGKVFPYNEFVVTARYDGTGTSAVTPLDR